MKSKSVHSESDVIYTIEDFRRDFGDINTLFNMIEFSHNKIQLTSQFREEKNIIDLINEIIQLRESLSKKESSALIVFALVFSNFGNCSSMISIAVSRLKDVEVI